MLEGGREDHLRTEMYESCGDSVYTKKSLPLHGAWLITFRVGKESSR